MESNENRALHEQIREIERGEAAAWVVYPPTPVWYPVGFGLWAATLALAIGLLEGFPQAAAQLGLIALMGALMAWDRRRRGTYPTGRPPRELHGAILRMVLGAAAVSGLAWWVGEQVDVWLAAGVAGIGAWAVVAFYEHEYAVITERLRSRLT